MNWEAYIIVFLTAATKFLISPFIAVNGFGMSIVQAFITVSSGATFGAIVFYSLGNKLINYSQKKRVLKIEKLKAAGKPIPKVMTKTNKIIIKAKHAFGIWGVAFLTAAVLSIPIGSIICVKFYRHKKSTIFVILFFIIINSILLSLIASYFPSLGN